MKIFLKRPRILNFFWNRRAELLTKEFWQKVIRVAIKELNFLNSVSREDFYLNLKTLEKSPWDFLIINH